MPQQPKWWQESTVATAPDDPNWRRDPVLAKLLRKRVIFWVVLCSILVASGSFIFYAKMTKRERLLSGAQSALDAGSYQEAATGIAAVLDSDPRDSEALRLMVEMLERGGARDGMSAWYQRLIDAEPGNLSNILGAAKHALDQSDFRAAEGFLARVPADIDSTQEADLQRVAARLAFEKGDHESAARIYAWIQRIAPSGGTAGDRLNAAITSMLISKDETERSKAIHQIEALVSDPTVGTKALRTLLEISLHRSGSRDGKLEELLSRFELVSENSIKLGPKLEALDFAYRAKDPRWNALLSKLQADISASAEINNDALYWVIQWMNDRGQSAEAIDWADKLELPERATYPLGLALAEAHINCGQWQKVRRLLEVADWGNLRFLKLAMLTKALDESAGQQGAQSRDMSWKLALNFAGKKTSSLRLLEVFLRKHAWTAMHVDVLWASARNVGPVEFRASACARLKRHYLAEGNLPKCREVAALAVTVLPSDYIEKANWIYMSLLLDAEDPDNLLLQSRDLFESHPEVSPVISNYAFARFCSRDYAGARELLHLLPEAFRRHPAVAPICGIILAGAGANNEAREYLELPHRTHFAAEQKLVAAARVAVGIESQGSLGKVSHGEPVEDLGEELPKENLLNIVQSHGFEAERDREVEIGSAD